MWLHCRLVECHCLLFSSHFSDCCISKLFAVKSGSCPKSGLNFHVSVCIRSGVSRISSSRKDKLYPSLPSLPTFPFLPSFLFPPLPFSFLPILSLSLPSFPVCLGAQPQGFRGITQKKFLKFNMRFLAICCILATNLWLFSFHFCEQFFCQR